MATNDGGAGPTDFSGVTYLGKPNENSSGSYHIKRSSGKVLGPFDADLIVRPFSGDGIRISVGEEAAVARVLEVAATLR
jgi:hypothetical protein